MTELEQPTAEATAPQQAPAEGPAASAPVFPDAAARERLAAMFVRRQREAAAQAKATAPVAKPDPRRNQGSVVAVVAVVAVLLIVIAGFALIMWRLHKSEQSIAGLFLELGEG